MPKGVYIKSMEHKKKISETLKRRGIKPATCGQPHSEETKKKISAIQKGKVAHNKGKQLNRVLNKKNKFSNGLPILCKKHGEHRKWRLYNDNNVQCLKCGAESQIRQRRKNPLRFIYRDAKKHAEKYNREFSINLDDLINLKKIQDNKCALTGIMFDYENPPSLDRIDSNLGYKTNNIQLILIQVNRMKSNFLEKDFIDMCKKITIYAEARRGKKKSAKK